MLKMLSLSFMDGVTKRVRPFPPEAKQVSFCLLGSAPNINESPFCSLFSAITFFCFFAFCVFFVCWFWVTGKCYAPKCKKAVMCLREKIQMFSKLLSGMSNGTVGCELSISESTIYVNTVSLNRNTHKTRWWIDHLVKIL